MDILLVFTHPTKDSFAGSICAQLQTRLEADGHAVRLLDLYGEAFDPVLGLEAWRSHRADRRHHDTIDPHVAALLAADGLVLVYPTWWYGLPAMLKGWIDRVFQPQVGFAIEDGRFRTRYLPKLKRFAVITTYGSPRIFIEWLVGDPVRRQLMRGLVLQFARGVRKAWAPIYAADTRSEADLVGARGRAVEKVAKLFAR